ncbi:MAG: phosphoribosyl-AMP cyclohydrolase, partial [Deltaproteobacteria bacterium]|nr:phosphoribosyl-AMP cyclohydrolase [Deltaproteobacteria bacterium]
MSKNISEKLKTPKAKLPPADLDFEKLNGLLPVIAQDESSGAVLMLAYANREAVQKTQETGYAHYWSRSRDVLWKKGESSGHLQKIV